MLLPWMAIWIALSIHAQIGACVGLAVCALLPFAFLKFRMTIFEPCSILAVGTICVLTLLDVLPLTLLPVSYLLFGLMWGVTVFLPMPLTAYYSMNGYSASEPAVHAHEPHSDSLLGSLVSAHADLDVVSAANTRLVSDRRAQFRSAHAPRRIHGLVPALVPGTLRCK